MGICVSDRNNKRDKNNSLFKTKTYNDNINNTSQNYLDKNNINNNKSSLRDDKITKSSSESGLINQKIESEIYSIENFGVKVNLKQSISEPLKFIFHFYNFKCKMSTTEHNIYIMQIIFDGKEYPLSFGNGNNPSFIFDETIGKEILFNKMSSSYMEIILYTHKNKSKNAQYFKNMTKGEILAETQVFSCLKIDLLTLALSPEKHDLILLDPKRKKVLLGRINYNLSCRQIEDISIQVKNFKLNLNNLNYNEISLNLKYENAALSLIKETEYTENFKGTPNNKDNVMVYQYMPHNELMISKTISKNNNLFKEKSKTDILINNSMEDFNDSICDDIEEYDENSVSEKLKLHGKMSLNDILNSEITLNLFSVRLNNRTDLDRIKSNDINLSNISNSPKIRPSLDPRHSMETKNIGIMRKKLDQMKSYTFMGMVPLNFYKILYDNEKKIERDASKFFHSMSNQKYDETNRTLSYSKLNAVGFEEDLNLKTRNKTKENNDNNIFQQLIISAYEDVSQLFKEEIINSEGDPIGFIEMWIDIIKLPLIKQTMFGVFTETGFEINSIFLYDNHNLSNSLPQELLDLIKLKEKFEYEISSNVQQFDLDQNLLNIMKQMKSILGKSIDESCLYFGYSDNDIFHAQEFMIDLGLILFELIDKLGLEHRKTGFEILKLILQRTEMDLETLSVVWFKTIKKSLKLTINNINNKNNICDYEIRDNSLLERRIIEKFFKFHLDALNYSLDNLIKGKNIDKESRDFTNYYLSISYFLNPMFREELIKQIYTNINFKNEKYLKCLKNMKKNINIFNEEDNFNKSQRDFIWDNSFYKKLEISLSKYSISRNNSNNNISNKYLKNVNAIKEQLSEIKYFSCTNDKNDDSFYYTDHNWCNKIKSRGFIFYDYILELLTYIKKILNKIDENNSNSKWINIPGISKIIEIINYDLIVKDAKHYPRQINEILSIFISEISIINFFITSIISSTNIYDTQSIFSLINILDYLFNLEDDINNSNKNNFKEKIDYKIILNSFLAIINTDNSLAIAKFIWFYYKNISLLSEKHVNKIITYIFIPNFFILFFHWSFQIRNIFYHFLIFIINHKMKNLIKSHKPKEMTVKEKNRNTVLEMLNFGIFRFNNDKEEEKKVNKMNSNNIKKIDKKPIYFFGNLLEEKMEVIKEIKNIIAQEKYDINYNNIIDKNKFQNIIGKIPEEYHTNIVLSIYHYNKVYKDFEEWEKNNKENNIEEKNIVYPKREIIIIKDDTVDYNNDI